MTTATTMTMTSIVRGITAEATEEDNDKTTTIKTKATTKTRQ